MEKQLFEYDSWDIVDTMVFQFYNITTKVKIGKHPPGSQFDLAVIDYENGFVELNEEKFPIRIAI